MHPTGTNTQLTSPRRFCAEDATTASASPAVLGGRRRTAPHAAGKPINAPAPRPPNAGPVIPTTAAGRPLRRWSVAELIARAAAAPPRTA